MFSSLFIFTDTIIFSFLWLLKLDFGMRMNVERLFIGFSLATFYWTHKMNGSDTFYCLFAYLWLCTTPTNRSRFWVTHIWFVSNIKQEQTICTTLDLIWRKQQVGQKLAFYFRPKLAVCSIPSQMCVILKKCSCLLEHAPMPHSN